MNNDIHPNIKIRSEQTAALEARRRKKEKKALDFSDVDKMQRSPVVKK